MEVSHEVVQKISMILPSITVIVFVDGNPIAANVAGSALLCSGVVYISRAWKVQRLYTPRETFHLRLRFYRLVDRSTNLISITSTIEAYSIAAYCSHPTKIRFTKYSLKTRSLSLRSRFLSASKRSKSDTEYSPPGHLNLILLLLLIHISLYANFHHYLS